MEPNNTYLKNMYSINYFNLAQKCPALLQINSLIPKDFIYQTIVFEDNIDIYKQSIENFASFIIYKIIKDSLETKANLVTYESYFYKTMLGFVTKEFPEKEFNSGLTAKYWMLLLKIQLKLDELINNKNVIKVLTNNKTYHNFKHLNSNIKNFSYYTQHLICLVYADESIDLINLFPFSDNYHNNLNMYILASLNYFKTSLKHIHCINISMENPSFNYKNIEISDLKFNRLNKLYESLILDFNFSKVYNCTSCIIKTSCSPLVKVYGLKPNIYLNKGTKINILNLET